MRARKTPNARFARGTLVRLSLGALVLIPALLGAQPASGYVIGGQAWPHGVITYYNAFPQDAAVVRAAVQAWNHSGARVRFVSVPRSRAHVILLPLRNSSDRFEGGNADMGWHWIKYTSTFNGKTTVRYRTVVEHVHLLGVDTMHGRSPDFVTIIATHELGHVLGLFHSHTCATMDATLVQRCRAPHSWQFACRLLQPDDVRGAIALYGGQPRPLGPQRFCNLTPDPTPPTGLKGTFSRVAQSGSSDHGFAHLTWKMPPSAIYLGTPVIGGYEVFVAPNTCSTAASALREKQSASPGASVVTDEFLPGPGAWCFAIATADVWGRMSPAVEVTVAEAPTALFTDLQDEHNGLLYGFTDQSIANAGTIVRYAWNFGDPASGASNTSTAQNPSHAFSAAGQYAVTETVTNSYGESDTDTETLVVQDYAPPTAAFYDGCASDGTCSLGFENPYTVNFTNQSSPGDGAIVSSSWNFGDPGSGQNNTSTDGNATHDYSAPGAYTVTLTVTDEHGKQASTSQTVYIDP